MRKIVVSMISALLVISSLAISAVAQHDPPKILSIGREEVKPGKSVAHNQLEAAWTQAFVKAKYTTPYLALSSVTGNSEVWFLTGFDSFAAMEKDSQSIEKNAALRNIGTTFSPKEADLLEGGRNMTARYRPELSYKPNINVGEYRYFSIAVVRFRLGESAEDFYKALNGAREKAGLDAHMAVYEVNSGMPAGTYISFTPLKSMASWDDPPNAAYGAALKDINFNQLVGKAILNVEFRLFAFAPQMSMVSDQMAAANPDFWRPKPVMAKKAAATGEVTPAAKKDSKPAEKK